MTHPKEAKHLTDAEIEKMIEEVLRVILPPPGSIGSDYKQQYAGGLVRVGEQAKAYNTVKGERDARGAREKKTKKLLKEWLDTEWQVGNHAYSEERDSLQNRTRKQLGEK